MLTVPGAFNFSNSTRTTFWLKLVTWHYFFMVPLPGHYFWICEGNILIQRSIGEKLYCALFLPDIYNYHHIILAWSLFSNLGLALVHWLYDLLLYNCILFNVFLTITINKCSRLQQFCFYCILYGKYVLIFIKNVEIVF